VTRPTWRGVPCIAALGFVVACGSTPPPKQLVDARMAYRHAEEGLAKDLAPADLDTAKQALASAEESFNDAPEDQKTLDLAYIAQRKAQIADANAAVEDAERRRSGDDKDYRATTEAELDKTRRELDAGKRELAAGKKELASEREARKKAESIAKAAMESLAEVAKVKAEKRGVVITLSGAVLFASGKATLLPIAKQKIGQVAATLKDQGSPPIRIEGHTDSTGSQTQNRKLSKRRADAVKSHMVSKGYPSSKVNTVGHGPDNPVADNSSAEGRANNRCVEIIVNPTS